jgi:hypothetical protein
MFKYSFGLVLIVASGCAAPDLPPSAAELCEQTVQRYGDLRDNGPAEAYADLFTTDGEFHLAGNITKGRDALIARQIASTEALRWRHNMTDIQVVEKNGEYFGITGFHIFAGPHSETPTAFNREILGNYSDKFTIEDGFCKIKSRKVEIVFDKKT